MGTSRIFVDANYFIALANPADSTHHKAIAISDHLAKENPELIISDYIFLEVATVVSQRVSRSDSIIICKTIQNDPQIEIIHINQDMWNLSWETFQRTKSKNLSFVDCSVIAVMQAEGINKLLTFDAEDFAPLQKKYHFSLLK